MSGTPIDVPTSVEWMVIFFHVVGGTMMITISYRTEERVGRREENRRDIRYMFSFKSSSFECRYAEEKKYLTV